jgi:hypothetical protein
MSGGLLQQSTRDGDILIELSRGHSHRVATPACGQNCQCAAEWRGCLQSQEQGQFVLIEKTFGTKMALKNAKLTEGPCLLERVKGIEPTTYLQMLA